MATTAQKFYLGTVDDDQTGGTTVKKIEETAPSANSATTNTWSVAGAQTRTHIPLAGSTTNSDTSSSNGWDFNNGGSDGLDSTSTAERWIKAGVWSFSMSYGLNAPALLQTIACTVTARVYRVATGGGTRTLLFTAASANFAATAVITWNSASQPEFVLASGEVIQVAFTAVSAATVDALSQVTPTVLTLTLGTNSFFNVPTPGVRTLSRGDYSLAGTGAESGAMSKVLGTAYALTGSGAFSSVGAPMFSGVFSLAGAGVANILGSSLSASKFSMSGNGLLDYKITKVLGANYAMDSGGSGGTTVINTFNVME